MERRRGAGEGGASAGESTLVLHMQAENGKRNFLPHSLGLTPHPICICRPNLKTTRNIRRKILKRNSLAQVIVIDLFHCKGKVGRLFLKGEFSWDVLTGSRS